MANVDNLILIKIVNVFADKSDISNKYKTLTKNNLKITKLN